MRVSVEAQPHRIIYAGCSQDVFGAVISVDPAVTDAKLTGSYEFIA